MENHKNRQNQGIGARFLKSKDSKAVIVIPLLI
jgi:hypothetical protein